MADEELRREAQELAILSGAFVRLAQRLHDRARSLEDALGGPLPAEPEVRVPDDPFQGAVLMATNLAALGHSREEIRAVLTESFDLEDPEPVLDRALG